MKQFYANFWALFWPALLAATAYYGLYLGVDGALNMLLFVVWLSFITSCLSIFMTPKGTEILSWRVLTALRVAAFLAVGVALIWYSRPWSGLAMLLTPAITGAYRDRIIKTKQTKEQQ